MSKLLKRLNDNQNKVADTNGIMKLQAWDHGVAQDLTNKQITATIANAGGFLFDLDLVSNGTEIDLDFKDSQLQKLTPDTYFIEIKVTDEAGDVSVFPTEGYATFTINKNLHATEGELVPQITFDTVLADVKKAVDEKVAYYTSTIKKGDKGDTGPAGKDAEIPIVGGRNYLLNSLGFNASASKLPTLKGVSPSAGQSLTFLNTGIQVNNTQGNAQWYYEIAKPWVLLSTTELIAGETYTMSLKVKGNIPQIAIRIGVNNSTMNKSLIKFADISGADWTRVVYTFTIPSDAVAFYFRINGANNNQYDTGFVGGELFTMKEIKLEAGNVATDWSPAPEDIQSDISERAIDTSVVHNTGNETIAGGKTFTSPINGQLAIEPENLFFNSEFENSAEGWNVLNGGGSLVISTSGNDVFGHPLAIVELTAGYAKFGNTRLYPTQGKVNYSLSSLVNVGTASGVYFIVDEFDSNKTQIKSTPYGLTSSASWGLKTASFVTQAQTKFVQVSYQIGGSSGQLAYITAPMWNTGAVPLPYVRGSEMQDVSQLVHNTGTESVAGDKTFTGNTTLTQTTILVGNYGLRVTPSGFQKTTDGKTWVSANI